MNSYLTNNKFYIESDDSDSDQEINENNKISKLIPIQMPIPINNNQNIEDKEENDSISSNGEEEEIKYIQPIILENFDLEKYFSKADVEKSKLNNGILKITDKGLYSISKYEDARWISDIIIKLIEYNENKKAKNLTIIDATAGIGGNTLDFAKLYKSVIAIEINSVHYDVLKNNLATLKIKNVSTINDNFLSVIDSIKDSSDIFFLDPPWGGKNYKNFKFFNLKIGKIYIYSIINILYSKKYKYVILKAPFNLNISPLIGSIKYQNLNIYKNSKQTMLIAIFY